MLKIETWVTFIKPQHGVAEESPPVPRDSCPYKQFYLSPLLIIYHQETSERNVMLSAQGSGAGFHFNSPHFSQVCIEKSNVPTLPSLL